MDKWIGRVALVTGASAGFGESIAKRLAEYGMKVVGCARNIEKIQTLADSLRDAKGSVTAIQCDISKEDQILAMFERIKRDFGGVDVCINNAGLSFNAPLLTGTTDQWRHMLDVNVLGLCVCTRETVNSMKERGVDDGHIVLINSMSGHRVVPNASHIHFYAATKYAVTAITEGLRNEIIQMKSHIRITSISPGLAKTEFMHRLFKEETDQAEKKYYFKGISPGMAKTEFTHRMLSDTPERADKAYSSFKPMTSDDVTDSVIYSLSAPVHVQVHDILIRPTESPY